MPAAASVEGVCTLVSGSRFSAAVQGKPALKIMLPATLGMETQGPHASMRMTHEQGNKHASHAGGSWPPLRYKTCSSLVHIHILEVMLAPLAAGLVLTPLKLRGE